LIDGIVVGCIYALVAVGFTIIYNATETVNFAVGESLMLSAFFALTFYKLWGWSYPATVVCTLLLAGLLGYVVYDRLVSRPMINAPELSRIIALVGLSSVLKGSARLVWGGTEYQMPSAFPASRLTLGPIAFTLQEFTIVAATVVIVALLYVFLNFTRLGTAMRATSLNRKAASLMGVNVASIYTIAWVLGTVLSAIGGLLLAPMLLVQADMGSIAFKSFAAVVLGGFGSLPGAIIGGIILGITENLASAYIRPDLQIGVTFLVLLGVLAIRPTGLLGRPRQRKV
jgi:branched-chain amino acid transport system permease protein